MISSLIFGWIWGYLLGFAVLGTIAYYLAGPLICIGALLFIGLILIPIAKKLDERDKHRYHTTTTKEERDPTWADETVPDTFFDDVI